MLLEAGDIYLTRGESIVSRGIRFLTRSVGESRTEVNHVGLVSKNGTEINATIIDVSSTVKRRKMSHFTRSKNTRVAIYRPRVINETQREVIVSTAEGYVGKKYGYGKIVLHFLDWCLFGAYVFRRLGRMQNYPICSWMVAYSYEAGGVTFGVSPRAASPDDIWDYLKNPSSGFDRIHPLDFIEEGK